MLAGLSPSVAPLKAGNTEGNEVLQAPTSCPLNRGKYTASHAESLEASLLNLKAPIHSGRILPGLEIQIENKCSELQDYQHFRNCALVLYLLFCKAQNLAQQKAKRYQVTESLSH